MKKGKIIDSLVEAFNYKNADAANKKKDNEVHVVNADKCQNLKNSSLNYTSPPA